jgi:hypothetical protein
MNIPPVWSKGKFSAEVLWQFLFFCHIIPTENTQFSLQGTILFWEDLHPMHYMIYIT